MRIGFLKTVLYENIAPRQGPTFERGEVYDCVTDFAERWIQRNVAVELPGGKTPAGKGDDDRWVKVSACDWTPDDVTPADDSGPAEAPAPPPEIEVVDPAEAARLIAEAKAAAKTGAAGA